MPGELLAVAAMLMFAANILATRAASSRLDVSRGFVISVTVNVLFSALAFIVEQRLRREPLVWDPAGIALFMMAGAFATYLGRWFLFGAIARLGAARASLFHVASPAFTAVIAWLFLNEALGGPTVIAMAATLIGLLLVSAPAELLRRSPGSAAARSTLLSPGFFVGIGATLAYAVGNVLRGASVRQWDEPIAGALLGAIAALALHFLIGKGHGLRGLATADRAGVALYALGGMLTIAAQMCMIASMRTIPVAIAAVITLCTPLVVIPASYWLFDRHERLNATTLLGAAITIGGVGAIVLR
ncbi:MAG TPA: DMT family transporter [Casimicrobiaceae bacterium]|nr:DMT family transporter [Casimicrobiaceae bacterium]